MMRFHYELSKTLQHCVDLMSRETEQWKKQLDKEKEHKNKIASKYRYLILSTFNE